MRMTRRTFLTVPPLLAALATGTGRRPSPFSRDGKARVGISLNAYSFNRPLRDGDMSLPELLRFCAAHDFDAVDPTGYYFHGYPEPPGPAELAAVKREAFLLGLDISGTGVRNDFATVAPDELAAEIHLVERWLEVARDLGAPNLRVFAGRTLPDGADRGKAVKQVAEALRRCARTAERLGVMLAIQNHFEFIRTPEQLFEILAEVDSPWVGVNLDVGSFRSADPYAEIAQAAPYAVAWQIKEQVYVDGQPRPVDLRRLGEIIRGAAYRGYVLLETLGPEDPFDQVPRFLERMREELI
jgi:sugar phosphate isomerase/epimerase